MGSIKDGFAIGILMAAFTIVIKIIVWFAKYCYKRMINNKKS